mmetsp:Transcript_4875/g.12080  ORF Transcript_4875/g.12080 Transcript_4875/m.12080 type:complete len:324 (-) Transcript_4875:401-1372(-)
MRARRRRACGGRAGCSSCVGESPQLPLLVPGLQRERLLVQKFPLRIAQRGERSVHKRRQHLQLNQLFRRIVRRSTSSPRPSPIIRIARRSSYVIPCGRVVGLFVEVGEGLRHHLLHLRAARSRSVPQHLLSSGISVRFFLHFAAIRLPVGFSPLHLQRPRPFSVYRVPHVLVAHRFLELFQSLVPQITEPIQGFRHLHLLLLVLRLPPRGVVLLLQGQCRRFQLLLAVALLLFPDRGQRNAHRVVCRLQRQRLHGGLLRVSCGCGCGCGCGRGGGRTRINSCLCVLRQADELIALQREIHRLPRDRKPVALGHSTVWPPGNPA